MRLRSGDCVEGRTYGGAQCVKGRPSGDISSCGVEFCVLPNALRGGCGYTLAAFFELCRGGMEDGCRL